MFGLTLTIVDKSRTDGIFYPILKLPDIISILKYSTICIYIGLSFSNTNSIFIYLSLYYLTNTIILFFDYNVKIKKYFFKNKIKNLTIKSSYLLFSYEVIPSLNLFNPSISISFGHAIFILMNFLPLSPY